MNVIAYSYICIWIFIKLASSVSSASQLGEENQTNDPDIWSYRVF